MLDMGPLLFVPTSLVVQVFGPVAFEFFCLFKSFSLDTFSLSQLNIHFYFGILNQYRTHNLHQKISSSFKVTQVSLQLLDP